MMHMGIGILSIINLALLIAGAGVIVLSIIVLLKLNKVLDIWLVERSNK